MRLASKMGMRWGIAAIFLFVPCHSSGAVFEYSINDKDGVVIVDRQGDATIKGYAHIPNPAIYLDTPFLADFLARTPNRFSPIREITLGTEPGTRVIKKFPSDAQWEIRQTGRSTNVAYRVGGRIKDRADATPPRPFYDVLDLFFLRTFQQREETSYAYSINSKGISPLACTWRKPSVCILADPTGNEAQACYNEAGVLESLTVSGQAGGSGVSFVLRLRGSKDDISNVGPMKVRVPVKTVGDLVEHRDQPGRIDRRSAFDRNGALYYLACTMEEFDIGREVERSLAGLLEKTGILKSDRGMRYIRALWDEQARRIVPSLIPDGCTLRYDVNHEAVQGLVTKVKTSYQESRLEGPVNWALRDDRFLEASVAFSYRRLYEEARRNYLGDKIKKMFLDRFRARGNVYQVTRIEEQIQIVAYRKALWGLMKRKIGEIMLPIAPFVNELKGQLASEDKSLEKVTGVDLDESGQWLILRIITGKREMSSDRVVISLSDDCAEKYGLFLQKYVMEGDGRQRSVRAVFEAQTDQILSMDEVIQTLQAKGSLPAAATGKRWELSPSGDGRGMVARLVWEEETAIPTDRIRNYLESGYDIVDEFTCSAAGEEGVSCSFWGFKK